MNERVRTAIDRAFEDTTVTQEETWVMLENIINYCRELQEVLDDAPQNQ